jgi:hypothetical protein
VPDRTLASGRPDSPWARPITQHKEGAGLGSQPDAEGVARPDARNSLFPCQVSTRWCARSHAGRTGHRVRQVVTDRERPVVKNTL